MVVKTLLEYDKPAQVVAVKQSTIIYFIFVLCHLLHGQVVTRRC